MTAVLNVLSVVALIVMALCAVGYLAFAWHRE